MKWNIVTSLDQLDDQSTLNLFVPLFAVAPSSEESPRLSNLFSFLLAVQLFILLLSAVVNGALIASLLASSLIHPNLKTIWLVHMAEYYLFAAAQVELICVRGGLISVNGHHAHNISLAIFGLLKLHFFWSTILTFATTIIERSVATRFIKKYEMIKTRRLSIYLCTFMLIFALLVSICMVFKIIGGQTVVAIIGILVVFSFILYCVLLSHNHRLLNGTISMYSLSSKYQIIENIRILTLVRNVFLATFCCLIAIGFSGLIGHLTGTATRMVPFLLVLADFMLVGFPLNILCMVWCDSRTRARQAMIDEELLRSRVQSYQDSYMACARNSLIYFKYLNNSWSKR